MKSLETAPDLENTQSSDDRKDYSIKQKGNFLPLLGVVFLVVFVGVVAYIYGSTKNRPQAQNLETSFSPQPTLTPSSNSDETADWKTYSGDGFSFRYPARGKISEQASVVTLKTEYTPDNYFDFLILTSQVTPFPTPVVQGNKVRDITNVESSTINLDGQKAESITVSCNAADCYYRLVHFKNGNKYYEANINIAGGGLDSLADRIFTTFKFTNSTTNSSIKDHIIPSDISSTLPTKSSDGKVMENLYISSDGKYVIFGTYVMERGAGKEYDMWVYDRTTQKQTNISKQIKTDANYLKMHPNNSNLFLTFDNRWINENPEFAVADGWEIVDNGFWIFDLKNNNFTFMSSQ